MFGKKNQALPVYATDLQPPQVYKLTCLLAGGHDLS